MKTSIRTYERKMMEKKLESGTGRGQRRGKGEGVMGFKGTLHGKVMGQ
jgi:hypothetical protein